MGSAKLSAAMCVLFCLSGASMATPVGSGGSTSTLVVNFSDGERYVFEVSYSPTKNGMDLFDVIEGETTLTTVRIFGGAFIDGISYAGHDDSGYGGGDDWWHYWIREGDAEPWTAAGFGPVDRTVADGTWDGWVYGNGNPPLVPEPAALLTMAAGAAALLGRRRRR